MFEDIDKSLLDDFDPEEEQKMNAMVIHEPPARTKDVEAVNASQDAADDYVYVRESLHTTLAQAQEALKGMTEFLNQSPSPRAFEVISGLIKTTSDVAKDLMEHQKTMKDLQGTKATTQEAETINNIQYNVTLPELLKALDGETDD